MEGGDAQYHTKQKCGYCRHEEIELALVKLAKATGKRKYFELSKYFIEERGQKPYYFDIEAKERGENATRQWANETESYSYYQAHRPVREQDKVVGHAVRAMYLYNGVISGISLDGSKFFYDNKLASPGNHHRQEWFGCACCPPNIARLLASIGEYVFSHSDNELFVNLYAQSKASFKMSDTSVSIEQKTTYPWNGDISIKVAASKKLRFAVMLRIPGWCGKWTASSGGKPVKSVIRDGYLRIEREWGSSETIRLHLDMPVERIYANPAISQDIGKVALQRGPVVYCVEEADLGSQVHRLLISDNTAFKTSFKPRMLGGISVVTGKGKLIDGSDWKSKIYRDKAPKTRTITFTAIPYFAWDNRKPGSMAIWLQTIG